MTLNPRIKFIGFQIKIRIVIRSIVLRPGWRSLVTHRPVEPRIPGSNPGPGPNSV